MKKHALFNNLTPEEYELFIQAFQEKHIPKETIIIEEGTKGDSAFLLMSGTVSVIKETMYGEDYVVTIIKAGGDEFFGEINLIDQGKRTSTIKTIEDSTILEINSDDFKKFMDKYPNIGYKVMWYMSKSLATHLRKADNDVITLFNALVEVVEND